MVLGKGEVRACADDIGIVLKRLSSLKSVFRLFCMFEKVSGLALKPPKCVIIPLSVQVTPGNAQVFSEWLHRELGDWAHFKIADKGKYLGIYLGPAAGKSQ